MKKIIIYLFLISILVMNINAEPCWIDEDDDGYSISGEPTITPDVTCEEASLTDGVTYFTSSGNDCDDNDVFGYIELFGYADLDNDGFNT